MDNSMPSKGNTLDSIIVALMISVQYLNLVITRLGFSSMLSQLIIFDAVLLLISVFVKNRGKIILNRKLMVLVLVLLLYYGISRLIPNGSVSTPLEFCAFCIIPVLCGSLTNINYIRVFELLMGILCLGLPVIGSIFAKANHSIRYDAVALSTAYILAPMILSGVFHFVYFRKSNRTLFGLLYLVSVVFFVLYIPNSYRGPLLSMFITLVILWIDKWELRNSPRKLIIAILLILTFVIIYYNLTAIMVLIRDVFGKRGIGIAAIDKSLILGSNLSDGRLDLYEITLRYIGESPIWGHGISTYIHYVPGVEYPHNFILQLLFDGGIILLFVFCIIVFPSISKIFRNRNFEPEGRVQLVLMLSGLQFTRAFFSGNIWELVQFWLLIGIIINNMCDLRNAQNEL